MEDKLIIAGMPVAGADSIVTVLYRNKRPLEIRVTQQNKKALLGNIYAAKIDKIQKNLNAAFVRFADGEMGYLPLNRDGTAKGCIMKTPRGPKEKLRPGDELLLQVEKEAVKTKLPRLTGNLSIAGRYLVVTAGTKTLHFSRKLDAESIERIRGCLSGQNRKECGMIVRTNAAEADQSALVTEYGELSEKMHRVLTFGRMAKAGSCLYRAEHDWMRMLQQESFRNLKQVTTDQEEIFPEIQEWLSKRDPDHRIETSLYRDKLLPLYKLYSMTALLDSLLSRKVYLKSGGSLIIEQTEAFAAIDVNSGSYIGKKNAAETAALINHEAAEEAARQIRLRQLSGTILIDFINMRGQTEQQEQLLRDLQEFVRNDPVRTIVVDMTALGIVELTREKKTESLAEQIQSLLSDMSSLHNPT